MTAFQALPTTILLFGDQTDSWIDGIDQLYKKAASTPWLKSFLDQLADVINAEAKKITLDRAIQDSLGRFSNLQEVGERYRYDTDQLGVVRCLLLYTVRVGTLLQWVKREPHLLEPHARTEWLGISGGLLPLSALAIADDFQTLYDACLEVGRLVVRICKLTSVRSRALEDQPGVWGWAVLGISLDDLHKALNQFQQSAGIPATKRAQVGVTGAGWSTIIGPPSVLQLVIKQCPAVRSLAKKSLEIRAIQHILKSHPPRSTLWSETTRPFWTDRSDVQAIVSGGWMIQQSPTLIGGTSSELYARKFCPVLWISQWASSLPKSRESVP